MTNTKKLFVLYIFVTSLFVFLTFWISWGYPGYPNSNLNGGISRLARFSCFSMTEPNCNQFRPDNSDYSLLLGDSEAISISDLFIRKFYPNGYVGAMTGCSFLPSSIHRKSQSQACRKLNKKVVKQLRSNYCGNIYIFNRFTPLNAGEEREYLSFLDAIAKSCKSLTIIGSPIEIKPKFSAYATMFFKATINQQEYYDLKDFNRESLRWNQRIQSELTKSSSEIHYIDTNSILITQYPTTLKNSQGEYYYFDSTHLSLFGGEKILASILNKS